MLPSPAAIPSGARFPRVSALLLHCHHERSEGPAFPAPTTGLRSSIGFPQSAAKSSHVEFSRSISATRLARSQPLISFSRWMAAPTSETSRSKPVLISYRLSEALDFACLLLPDSPFEVVGDSGVNAARLLDRI